MIGGEIKELEVWEIRKRWKGGDHVARHVQSRKEDERDEGSDGNSGDLVVREAEGGERDFEAVEGAGGKITEGARADDQALKGDGGRKEAWWEVGDVPHTDVN